VLSLWIRLWGVDKMANYELIFWISLGLNGGFALIFIIYSIMKHKKQQKIGRYVNDIRKEIRVHHRNQKKLFHNIDKFMQLVPDMVLDRPQPQRKEKEWNEYG